MDISSIMRRDVGFKADITGISYDSRKAREGDLFFCLKGFNSDGHKYAKSAYDNGARVFAVTDDIDLPSDAHIIKCNDTRHELALASDAFFEHPSKSMYTIGITGTKGKTSTSFMLRRIFECAGKKVGIIGTMGIYCGDEYIESHNSTPESYVIHSSMAKMRSAGCDVVIMEASSQGFKMHRTDGIMFDAGIFTNISPDHIGPTEHDDFEEYLSCKCMLARQSKKMYVNADMQNLDALMNAINSAGTPFMTFGKAQSADFRIKAASFGTDGNTMATSFVCETEREQQKIVCNMPGEFSIYNALAATVAARGYGIDWQYIRQGLSSVYVEGRMEVLQTGTDYSVIIDFAHNAISCEKLFETIKLYSPKRIISIFGCGGNRSLQRRADMGYIIGKNSDISIVTADNPRTEPIAHINMDIKQGLDRTETEQIYIDDRKAAIHAALDMAQAGDCILLIGKGHEKYQEVGDGLCPFCERDIVFDYFASK